MPLSNYNQGVSITELVNGLEPGLDRAVLRVLAFHIGRENAISRGKLRTDVANHGFAVHERALRACIGLLRKAGQPICSTGGEDGGYWLGTSIGEVQDYVDHEINSRIKDLAETKEGILRGARERWGEGIQGKLF